MVTMTERTIRDVTVHYGPSGQRRHLVTVPAGTRVRPTGDGRGYFVEDLSWLTPDNPDSFERHDATYYGIVVSSEDVSP